MSIAALIRELAAAGASAEAIAIAVEAIERAQAAADGPRAAARARKQRQRERERDMSRDSHAEVTGQERDEPAPSPSPLPFPQTPKLTPHPLPHPEGFTAHTRGLAAQLVLAVVVAGCQAAKPKPKPRWPKDMPPPAGVSDDQWAGFIDHRKSRRERLTPRAYELLCAKLAKHADTEWPPGRIIDQIVERNWLSFEPSWLPRQNETRNGQRHHQHDRSGGWAPRPGMEGVEPASLDDDEPRYVARH